VLTVEAFMYIKAASELRERERALVPKIGLEIIGGDL